MVDCISLFSQMRSSEGISEEFGILEERYNIKSEDRRLKLVLKEKGNDENRKCKKEAKELSFCFPVLDVIW